MIRSTYTTASGRRFDVSNGAPITLNAVGAVGWGYSATDGMPYRDARSMSGELVLKRFADRALASELMELCAIDMDNGTPGTWEVGGWEMRCFVVSAEASSLRRNDRIYAVELLAPDPVWRRSTSHDFTVMSGTDASTGGFDFPHDYPHDFGGKSMGTTLNVGTVSPCDFKITVFGYAAKPSIFIGGNRYGVDVVVPDGGLLVIDSTKKKSMNGDSVVLLDKYGTPQDVFSKRVKGAEGGGSYIFERIKPGVNDIVWDQGFGFTLELIERRAVLPWT